MVAKGNRPKPNDNEHFFADHTFLVSKTDTRGIITYANSTFVEMAAYSEMELLGANHNIVRHPDMPKAAFKDLWDTVEAGQEWRGLVKNLRKDGGFYWVDAMVTPSYRQGQLIGYMSVRRQPDRAAIAAVIPTYAQMIAQEQGR